MRKREKRESNMYILGNADKNLLIIKEEENKYYDENIKINIDDTNNTHSIIASKVKNGSNCLDIGCGAGYIGEILKENRKCTVYGIDIDKEAIETAVSKKIYKEIFNFSIMDYSSKKFQNFLESTPNFDYIFLADVLEHVVNPGEVLYNFSKKLNNNGKFLISVPNIAHFDIIKGLIDRTFNYNKIGILDNTHLRFFTKHSFVDMIDEINEIYGTNFSVKLIGKTINNPGYLQSYPNLLEVLDEDKEACVLQYVYEVENKAGQQKNKQIEKKDYSSIIEQRLNERKKLSIELENHLKEKEKISDELEKEKKNNIELNKNLQILNEKIEYQQNEYQKLINSKSWKITEPLRKISFWLHSKKKK